MTSGTWLVTGGAGYVGAHVVRALKQVGIAPIVIDSLETGSRMRLDDDVVFHQSPVSEVAQALNQLCAKSIDGVVHLAGYKNARESHTDPLRYWENNVGQLLPLLRWAVDIDVKNFIFSSSSSLYGHQADVTESSPVHPVSPYGRTKAAGEVIIKDIAAVSGMRSSFLRYFNVIGCDTFPNAHDTGADNVVPRFVDAVMAQEPMHIYGTTHQTPDGSCLRDYVDVRDLAMAHAVIAERMTSGREVPQIVNVAVGAPISVLEIADGVREAANAPNTPIMIEPAHPADPPAVWARRSELLAQLGWQPRFTMMDSLRAHMKSVQQCEEIR